MSRERVNAARGRRREAGPHMNGEPIANAWDRNPVARSHP